MLETDRDLKGLNDSGLSSTVGQNNSLESISLSSTAAMQRKQGTGRGRSRSQLDVGGCPWITCSGVRVTVSADCRGATADDRGLTP